MGLNYEHLTYNKEKYCILPTSELLEYIINYIEINMICYKNNHVSTNYCAQRSNKDQYRIAVAGYLLH